MLKNTSNYNNSVRINISDYLEFDVSELFDQGDLITIFGGAVRDSISDVNHGIFDVDILIGSKQLDNLRAWLETKGYYYDTYVSRDIDRIYADINIISEPHTFINSNLKKIQLIRPRLSKLNSTSLDYISNYNRLIKEVDLSCCGVTLDRFGVSECVDNSIYHCEMKKFIVRNSIMNNPKRIEHRKSKLLSRGWEIIEPINEKNLIRKHKINKLIDI